MKILLISPRTRNKERPKPGWLPLGLASIASVLMKSGHQVQIFDRHAIQARIGIDKNAINAEMLEKVNQFQPDLVGFNTITQLIYDTVECVDLLRPRFPVPFIAGGHHASALPELTLQKIAGLNGVVQGEGEHPLTWLADGNKVEDIPGLYWKNNDGSITYSEPRQIKDLDSLPFPAYDLLDMSFYTRPTLDSIKGYLLSTVSILTSRGCPYTCSFCTEHLTYGRGVRFHSPGYIGEWLNVLYKNYGMEGVYFLDNDFLIDEQRARQVCEELLRSGLSKKIKWSIQARSNRINQDLLKALKKAGCISIEMGIESFLQNELDQVDKKTEVEINKQAILWCREARISVHTYLISGFENESLTNIQEKLKWIQEVKPNTFNLFPLTLYPATNIYEKYGEQFFEKNQWTEADVIQYYSKQINAPYLLPEKKWWKEKIFNPYYRRRMLINIMKVNPIGKTLPLISRMGFHFLKRRIKKYISLMIRKGKSDEKQK